MNLPKFDHNKGSKGVNLVEKKVMDELGWIFREQPTQDYGIDGHIEVVDDEYVTGRLIAVQIKAGNSYLNEESNSGYVFRGKIEHYHYWSNHSLPVLLILCDLEKEICYWEKISEDNVQFTSDSNWKVVIPSIQVITRAAVSTLKEIAENTTEYGRRLNQLVLARRWMDELREGNKVIIESDEWINKTSGRGSIFVKIIDSRTEEEKTVLEWPMVSFPFQSYEDVFPNLFPWAHITVDEAFYEEYDEAEFLSENAVWDKEAGDYIVFGEYQEWNSNRPKIRPYTTHSGEVASYRLCLELNELGNSFLTLDNYLRSGLQNISDDNTKNIDPTRWF